MQHRLWGDHGNKSLTVLTRRPVQALDGVLTPGSRPNMAFRDISCPLPVIFARVRGLCLLLDVRHPKRTSAQSMLVSDKYHLSLTARPRHWAAEMPSCDGLGRRHGSGNLHFARATRSSAADICFGFTVCVAGVHDTLCGSRALFCAVDV